MKTHTITLVGCCREKLAGCSVASELYRSPLFRKAKAYAEQLGHEWRILSAAHGTIIPTTKLMPYDVTLHAMSAAERAAWDRRIVSDLDALLVARDADRLEVVLLAGEVYAGWIPAVASWCTVHQPMKGLQVGERLAWLNAQTKTARAAA